MYLRCLRHCWWTIYLFVTPTVCQADLFLLSSVSSGSSTLLGTQHALDKSVWEKADMWMVQPWDDRDVDSWEQNHFKGKWRKGLQRDQAGSTQKAGVDPQQWRHGARGRAEWTKPEGERGRSCTSQGFSHPVEWGVTATREALVRKEELALKVLEPEVTTDQAFHRNKMLGERRAKTHWAGRDDRTLVF